jgi:hypothetical protein
MKDAAEQAFYRQRQQYEECQAQARKKTFLLFLLFLLTQKRRRKTLRIFFTQINQRMRFAVGATSEGSVPTAKQSYCFRDKFRSLGVI